MSSNYNNEIDWDKMISDELNMEDQITINNISTDLNRTLRLLDKQFQDQYAMMLVDNMLNFNFNTTMPNFDDFLPPPISESDYARMYVRDKWEQYNSKPMFIDK